MNQFIGLSLKAIHKTYGKIFRHKSFSKPDCEQDPDIVAELIYDELIDDKPCMIARFGSTEMAFLSNFIGIKNHQKRYFDYISGKSEQWWWNTNIKNQMQEWSGFFPPTENKLKQFYDLMIQDIPLVDILGSWLPNEQYFNSLLGKHNKVRLIYLDPFWARRPWTKALEGKNVLVIHPFVNTIERQFEKRALLFEDDLLPEFNLKTIKAVQSIAGNSTKFNDWFEALDYMKEAMDRVDYDVCLVGAGAYGFPLAAHAKRSGNKGFHMGGSLQLLFGIKGNRWENPDYKRELGLNYLSLFNKHWVRPTRDERPQGADKVENATYW